LVIAEGPRTHGSYRLTGYSYRKVGFTSVILSTRNQYQQAEKRQCSQPSSRPLHNDKGDILFPCSLWSGLLRQPLMALLSLLFGEQLLMGEVPMRESRNPTHTNMCNMDEKLVNGKCSPLTRFVFPLRREAWNSKRSSPLVGCLSHRGDCNCLRSTRTTTVNG